MSKRNKLNQLLQINIPVSSDLQRVPQLHFDLVPANQHDVYPLQKPSTILSSDL